MKYAKENRVLLWLFAGVCVFQALWFAAAVYVDTHVADLDGNTVYHFPIHGQDSPGYVALAENLDSTHSFSYDGVTPETLRTPGYPALLLAAQKVFGFVSAASLIQIVLSGLLAVVVFSMASALYSRKIALAVALVFSLSPNVTFHSLALLSDMPFTFCFMLSLFLLFFREEKPLNLFAAGAALGVSALIRPVSLYLPFVLLPFFLLRAWQQQGSMSLASKGCLVFGLGFLLCVFPWFVRNRVEVGVWGFSSISTYNFAYYNIPEFLESTYGDASAYTKDYKEHLAQIPMSRMQSFAGASELSALMSPVLHDHPLRYALFHIEQTSKFFLSSSVRYTVMQLQIPALQQAFGLTASSPDLLSELRHGHLIVVARVLREQALFTLDRLFMIAITLLAVLSLCIRRNRFYTLLFLVLTLYFALLTGPVSIPRYRLPVEPLLYMLAFSTAAALLGVAYRLYKRVV